MGSSSLTAGRLSDVLSFSIFIHTRNCRQVSPSPSKCYDAMILIKENRAKQIVFLLKICWLLLLYNTGCSKWKYYKFILQRSTWSFRMGKGIFFFFESLKIMEQTILIHGKEQWEKFECVLILFQIAGSMDTFHSKKKKTSLKRMDEYKVIQNRVTNTPKWIPNSWFFLASLIFSAKYCGKLTRFLPLFPLKF